MIKRKKKKRKKKKRRKKKKPIKRKGTKDIEVIELEDASDDEVIQFD